MVVTSEALALENGNFKVRYAAYQMEMNGPS